ncbi:hypothetical protein PLICRDRAFT_47020 [Plicaturopsis crispa FD-325 SS-3]|uniref:DUF6534 domain-containing protein n=1 Tax=Plicaturopsis crispa FD-325 SS-3 TaxID=944288 RepID=A0A0C9SQJ3_PLICR|nr:hypothetical protein PLICRDRAFT_47020 [Plicaturopsis crispa FD-325 SS-3]
MSNRNEMIRTLGAAEVGAFVSSCLFGAVCAQVYTYFRRKSTNDAMWIRAFVGIVWLCELANTISSLIALYVVSVTGFDNPQVLLKPPASLYICIFLGNTTATLTQSFFARRIWILSGSLYIAVLCWVLGVSRFVLSILALGHSFTSVEGWDEYLLVVAKRPLVVWLVISAVTDLIIAGSLCYYFGRERAQAISRMAAVLDRLIVWAIQTGMVTSFASLATLIVFVVAPGDFAWLAMLMCLPRLFSSSLLTSLNARATFRHKLETTTVLESVSVRLAEAPSSVDSARHAETELKEAPKAEDRAAARPVARVSPPAKVYTWHPDDLICAPALI